jgi:Protein of unknown function (DUF2844)
MPTRKFVIEFKNLILSGVALAAVLGPCVALATLGEPEVSVQADVAQNHGSLKVMDRSAYRVHEIQSPSGTIVREFVGNDGVVFAVAWTGPVMPNLQQTLGRYFDSYVASAKANRLGHHQLLVRQEDLVIESRGHMRAFAGRAYLPLAIPAGVTIGDLQ